MNTSALHGNQSCFSQTEVYGTPLLPNPTILQTCKQGTLGTYIDDLFQGQELPVSCAIPVVDQYLYPLRLHIQSVDGKGIRGFWRTPFCNKCAGETATHPCLNTNARIDCDMFCAGSLYGNPDDEPDNTRDLTGRSLCHTNSRNKLTTCGILVIVLHHQQRSGRNVLVSVELSIGCDDTSTHVFVVQRHEGLIFSLK